ncbi:MAG: hypothetical protein LQ337_003337 [Flavoplaca oasis]|nr:MAG: hypothetical protein LQ337_003337 [Flavoplaca oasis]
MTSDDEGQLTKAFKFRPSRQAIITDLAAQAVFRPDEVVPYPASLTHLALSVHKKRQPKE